MLVGAMHIAIIGSGAVGGYYGAKLAAAGQKVTFIARGAHLRAIRERGLLVWSPLGDFVARGDATDDAAAVGAVDLVLYCVKAYDNDTALPLIPPLCRPGTVVLTLQNGVESAETVASVVDRGLVVGGTTYIATALKAPGVIEQTGTFRRIVFGEVFDAGAELSPRVASIRDVLASADIQVEAVADARVPLWEKFIYLAPLAGFTAATRLATGFTWGDPVIREQFLAAVREVEALARAEGVAVSPEIVDRVVGYMNAVSPAMRSSLLIDLSLGKRLELEALQGAVVRRSRSARVASPIMTTLYCLLKPWVSGPPLSPVTAS